MLFAWPVVYVCVSSQFGDLAGMRVFWLTQTAVDPWAAEFRGRARAQYRSTHRLRCARSRARHRHASWYVGPPYAASPMVSSCVNIRSDAFPDAHSASALSPLSLAAGSSLPDRTFWFYPLMRRFRCCRRDDAHRASCALARLVMYDDVHIAAQRIQVAI